MKIKSYRAKSIHEAMRLVYQDLGPDAAVLYTREVPGGLLKRLLGARQVEVTASNDANVPSRFTANQASRRPAHGPWGSADPPSGQQSRVPPAHEQDFRQKFREDIKGQLSDLQSKLGELCLRHQRYSQAELPPSLFRLFTDLIDAELSEDLARELIDTVRASAAPGELDDPVLLKARIARLIENQIKICGPIEVVPGRRRLAALIGPTGVGKTTTIAKLAASFHLREKRRVGLITVDTYRIAAVEQLRTYADIIDLPMEVVSTPRQMREAVARLAHLDLILMDTAGRSPRDDIKIQELRAMLAEANADEVHLVLSSVAGATSLIKTAQHFQEVGATSLLITKLDEANGLGNLLPLVQSCDLPLSYVTHGQNVPDDIRPADSRHLARLVLGMESGQ
jgi:flagellar biosynthesis protein FlhF